MSWVLLFVAGILEVGWSVGMKYSYGFSKLYPSIFTLLIMIASFVCLAFSMRSLPLGTAYAVWTGIGTVGAATVGMIAFGESASPLRIVCLGLIVTGILGLKLLAAK